jgi:hypothetical protein
MRLLAFKVIPSFDMMWHGQRKPSLERRINLPHARPDDFSSAGRILF